MTIQYQHSTLIAAPFSVTSVLTHLSAAVEAHLTARGPDKIRAWKHLEAKLAEAQDLLKVCI